MIPDWETDTVLLSDLLPRRYPLLVRLLLGIFSENLVTWHFIQGTVDIWARDYSPIQATLDQFVQFTYRPDYLRRQYEQLRTGPEVFQRLPFFSNIEQSSLVIDGGNIVSDGVTGILTDKIYSENPTRNRSQIQQELKRRLRLKRLIIVPQEPDDVFGHADGMLRFLSDGRVLVNDYSSCDPDFGKHLHDVLSLQDLKVETLPYRISHETRGGINSAVGNYINFLKVSNLTVVPHYGLPEDQVALNALSRFLPDDRVIPLCCHELACEGGVLNCVTSTIQHSRPAT